MPAPVVVRITVEGVDQVAKAFRRVEDAVVRGERAGVEAATKGARARVNEAEREARDKARLADREAREKIAAWKAADKTIADALKLGLKEAEKAARDGTRIEEKAARDKARIAETEMRTRERGVANLAGIKARYLQQEVRDMERAESSKTRIAEAAARSRARFAGTIAGAGMTGAQAGISRVGGITSGVAGTVLSLGGGFTIADALQGTMALQRSSALLSNSAVGVNGVTAAQADPKHIESVMKAASIESGVDANELAMATRSYIAKSSDFKGGMENAGFIGKVSKATGTDVNDVAMSMGQIRSQNADLSSAGARSMLLNMVMQGKQGSVEMDKLAGSAGKITRSATSYGGDQGKTQQELLGLAQIAVRTRGTAAGAAIAMSSIGSDTRNHQDKIDAALGYKTLDSNGRIKKGPGEHIADILAASGGDLTKLGQKGMGFGKPAMGMFEALLPAFTKAQAAYAKDHVGDTKGANAAGRTAIMSQMKDITGQSMTESQLDEMVKKVLSTPTEQFEAALREMKMVVGAELLPEFVRMIPVIKDIIPLFTDVAKTSLPAFLDLIRSLAEFAKTNRALISDIAAHPIGALMAKEVIGSIVGAGLGAAMRTSIGQSIGGAGIAIGSAVLMIQKLAAADDKVVNDGANAMIGSANARQDLAAGVRNGTLTKEQIAEKEKAAEKLRNSINEGEGNKGGGTAFRVMQITGSAIADGATFGAAGSAAKGNQAHRDRIVSDEKQLKEQRAELAALTRDLANAGKALAKMSAAADAAAKAMPGAAAGGGGGDPAARSATMAPSNPRS